jgi:hypothetical protein
MDVMNMNMNTLPAYPPFVSPGPAGYPRRLSRAAVASAGCALSEILLVLLAGPVASLLARAGSLAFLLFPVESLAFPLAPAAAAAALILGIIALCAMGRRRERGRGLAITGLVVGALGLVFGLVAVGGVAFAMLAV